MLVFKGVVSSKKKASCLAVYIKRSKFGPALATALREEAYRFSQWSVATLHFFLFGFLRLARCFGQPVETERKCSG